MEIDPIDKVIMDTTLSSIENLNTQIGIVSREIFRYAWESEDVKLISITGINGTPHQVFFPQIDDDRCCTKQMTIP